MNYGYIRVSTLNQKVDRQKEEMIKFGITKSNLYQDKQSGKDFERENYQKLIKKLKKGDLLVIKSIDRLGRNYNMIIEEWQKITKKIQADILVLDMPLLDTRARQENLVGRFISDIVLQILSFVAQNERELIRQRQKEGIALAKLKGIHLGRPKINLPKGSDDVIKKYLNKEITLNDAAILLNMTKGTLIRRIKEIKCKNE